VLVSTQSDLPGEMHAADLFLVGAELQALDAVKEFKFDSALFQNEVKGHEHGFTHSSIHRIEHMTLVSNPRAKSAEQRYSGAQTRIIRIASLVSEQNVIQRLDQCRIETYLTDSVERQPLFEIEFVEMVEASGENSISQHSDDTSHAQIQHDPVAPEFNVRLELGLDFLEDKLSEFAHPFPDGIVMF